MKKRNLIWIIPLFLLFLLLLFRGFLPREIDDVSSMINCEQRYLEKSQFLIVIPKFDGVPISEDRSWCEKILSLNKTLVLHGVNHTYKEFNKKIEKEELEEAIKIFQECFNQTPKFFKAPQLALSRENKILLESYNLTIKGRLNQFTHKVYHCEDISKDSKGIFKNWFIDLF